ncbi:MAG: prephenate dehydrogenase/arogenate dehydrogenase family protein [Chloroflexi bacterium]|nr:prephenate dehydrogenase/arogenate dehydrogenase family protein [Chloroflexota bacterium]
MTDGPPARVAFLGLGLIAGSIARALRDAAAGAELIAWSPTNAGPEAAAAGGTLDRVAASIDEALDGADLVILGAPPLETLALVERFGADLRGTLAPDAVVTDVSSTKLRIVAAADAASVRFVGGHPMAGREKSGYGAADARLFEGRPWVIVPGAMTLDDGPALARVEWLAAACGARPVRMLAADHDRAVAAISHAPLVVAAALVEAIAGGSAQREDWPAAATLAATGWRDMTRLARGDARMGAGIAATNSAALAVALRRVRDVLDAWIHELEVDGGGDAARAEALEARLRAVRERLEASAPPASG